MLKRITAVLCLAVLVCAVTALPAVQASDTSPPLVAVLDAQMGMYVIENLNVLASGDPWTEPCVPSCPAALIGGGMGISGLDGGSPYDTGTRAYPLLL